MGYDGVISVTRPAEDVDALWEIVKGGFDPATDPHHQKAGPPHAEMYLLRSALDGAVEVEVLGIHSAGSEIDVQLVQGRICSWAWRRSHPRP